MSGKREAHTQPQACRRRTRDICKHATVSSIFPDTTTARSSTAAGDAVAIATAESLTAERYLLSSAP